MGLIWGTLPCSCYVGHNAHDICTLHTKHVRVAQQQSCERVELSSAHDCDPLRNPAKYATWSLDNQWKHKVPQEEKHKTSTLWALLSRMEIKIMEKLKKITCLTVEICLFNLPLLDNDLYVYREGYCINPSIPLTKKLTHHRRKKHWNKPMINLLRNYWLVDRLNKPGSKAF